MGFLDSAIASLFMGLKQPIESFVKLETADDEYTFVATDGSLVTFMRVDGARQIIGESEYARIVEQSTVKLGSRFDRPGYALQFYFARDPERIRAQLDQLMAPNRAAAETIGLELDDLFDERARNLERFLSWEESYLVCWTRGDVLSKSESMQAMKEAKERKWVPAKRAQYPFAAVPGMRARHKSFVISVQTAMEELGIQVRLTEVHEALRAVRSSMFPSMTNRNWKPCLPGDKVPARMAKSKRDYSDVLWPPIRHQVSAGDAEVLTTKTVRLGDLVWSGVDMSLGPMDPTPFPVLLGRLAEADIPFRVSFLIESGGIEGAAVQKFVSGVLAFSNDENRQIKDAIEALEDLSRDEPVVKFRTSFATWAPRDDTELLDVRIAALMQSIESWGYAQVSQNAGDPLEGVLSSALGISCSSTATPGVAPLVEVVKLLPWQRASSPFETGSCLLRTPDGRVWPYQTGSRLTTLWFDLIFAQPGAGKSVLLNTLNLATCLTAGMSKMPYIAILDIGPSSEGLITMLRDALPPDRRYEASHFRLRMTPEYSVNPFDTQLGCRQPLTEERSYLVELVTLLCTAPGAAAPYDGITQLAGMVVDEMYRWRDDSAANAEPRGFLPKVDEEVDEAIEKHNIKLPEDPYWWDVVDALFDLGLFHTATLAQRHAVPTLADAVTAARRPQIQDLLGSTTVGGSPETITQAFERMISSSIRELPILAGVTQFDIGASRVTAVDLGEVAPQGDATADRQTAIMYMLARNALVRHWWIGPQILKYVPERYRGYHENRIKDIKETPKRICFDEFHRTSKTQAVRAQVVRDVREGRKWGVQIVLSSQLLEDFDDNMVDLATGVWVLGAAISDRAVNFAAERFGMSDTARWVMRNRLTGPRASGAPALLILGTNEGRYEQFLINTLGPIELWALSTSAEDVVIRTALYSRLGAQAARQVLAAHFPGGSARTEINRRVQIRIETGEVKKGAQSAVIAEIVDELVEYSVSKVLERSGFNLADSPAAEAVASEEDDNDIEEEEEDNGEIQGHTPLSQSGVPPTPKETGDPDHNPLGVQEAPTQQIDQQIDQQMEEGQNEIPERTTE